VEVIYIAMLVGWNFMEENEVLEAPLTETAKPDTMKSLVHTVVWAAWGSLSIFIILVAYGVI
jgi:hypothetical protein